MGDPFDPYHKWLGIAPFEQPANHYRLLGIRNFEADKDVIDSATEQRMTYLHTVDEGEDVPVAQRLLNEVSNARLTLLSDEKRRAYDEGLKHGLDSMPIANSTVEAVSDVEISPARPASRSEGASGKRRKNKTGWPAPALILIAALAAAMLSMAGLLLFRNKAAPSKVPVKTPSSVIAQKKQEGVPDAQHEVLSSRGRPKDSDHSAKTSDRGAVSTKETTAPEPVTDLQVGPQSGETDAAFPIGTLRDTPSEARVVSRNINEHVAAEPAGDQWHCRFRLPGFEDAREVFLAGDFNGWNTTKERMQRSDGDWEASVSLKPQSYEYKFMVDGKWQPDGENHRLDLSTNEIQPNPVPETTGLSRSQSREDARVILDTAGLHESETGVWSLNKTTSFAQREYERLKKDSDVRRALKTVGGRLQGQQ